MINGYWGHAEFPWPLIKKLAKLRIVGDGIDGYGCPPMSPLATGRGDGVAGSRPSVRACGSGARGDEHRDRGSNFTAPPHYDPAAPSHVSRHSLKGMTAVLLGRRERWRRWDAERSDLSMFAPTG